MRVIAMPVHKQLWILSALLLLAAFLVSPGFFSIDEAIYYLGARAIAEHGALGLDNGLAQLQSDSLRLRFLIDGPQGLTPQYPAGSALLTAPLLPLLEARAFILLNVLAAIGTLFTVRNICLSQFKSETVARIAIALLVAGTFWLEYAVGVWPHMLSSFFAIQAYWHALRHLDADERGYRYAILSGLFAGAGMLFRLDAILAVPAIGLILVLFARRFVPSSFWFGAAVLPSLALAAWLNFLKFGSPNPFSYGRTFPVGSGTDLSGHIPLFAALCVGFGAVLLWRTVKWRPSRKATLVSLAIIAAGLLVIPVTNALILRFVDGFWALFVDLRTVEDSRRGVQAGPGDTLIFWYLVKKSLGQSMPWIGLLAILLTGGARKGERRFVATLLVFIATMTMPFTLLSWHGGGGSNMRYFLPVLPALCILCARLISDLWTSGPNPLPALAAGIWAALALLAGWILLHPSGYGGVQQIVATYLLLATALAAAAAGRSWRFRPVARQLAIALFAGGLIVAMTSAISDFRITATRRAMAHGISKTLAELPPRSLVITHPEWATRRLPGNGILVASRDPETKEPDPRLIINALDAGYRVFVTDFEFDIRRDVPPGMEAVATNYEYPFGRMIELRWWPGFTRTK